VSGQSKGEAREFSLVGEKGNYFSWVRVGKRPGERSLGGGIVRARAERNLRATVGRGLMKKVEKTRGKRRKKIQKKEPPSSLETHRRRGKRNTKGENTKNESRRKPLNGEKQGVGGETPPTKFGKKPAGEGRTRRRFFQ